MDKIPANQVQVGDHLFVVKEVTDRCRHGWEHYGKVLFVDLPFAVIKNSFRERESVNLESENTSIYRPSAEFLTVLEGE